MAPHPLALSATANVIMPYHRTLDGCREDALGGEMIGTTRKGIGPCYEDKAARRGVRLAELLDPTALRRRLEGVLPEKNRIVSEWYGKDTWTVEGLCAELAPIADRLRPYVGDTVSLLPAANESGEAILQCRGEQGDPEEAGEVARLHGVTTPSSGGGRCRSRTPSGSR